MNYKSKFFSRKKSIALIVRFFLALCINILGFEINNLNIYGGELFFGPTGAFKNSDAINSLTCFAYSDSLVLKYVRKVAKITVRRWQTQICIIQLSKILN
jgi:hypothetical protein